MVHTKDGSVKSKECEKACSASSSSERDMFIHTDLHERPFQCNYCEFVCRDSSSLKKHEELHLEAVKVYECKICNKSFKLKWELRAHIEIKHFGLKLKKYLCQICDKEYRSKNILKKHFRLVHEVSTCQCQVCGDLVQRDELAEHMRRHLAAKAYKCKFKNCGRWFRDQIGLRQHSIIHYPEKQHPCGICGRLFAKRLRLADHMATHSSRSRPVECTYCGVLFYSQNYLRLHIAKKHNDRAKKFMCDFCNFTTAYKPYLIVHLKDHRSERRDIKCHTSGKDNGKHENLKIHYMNTHKTQFKTPPTETQVTPVDVKQEVDDDDCIEYHPEIDLLEIHKEEFIDTEYSDPITVLTDDLCSSNMQNDRITQEKSENESDDFLIERSDNSLEKSGKGIEKSDKYNIDGGRMSCRAISVEIDVEKLDNIDAEELPVSRERSVDVDVEKFDKHANDRDRSEIDYDENSDSSMEDLGEYCVETPAQEINEENLIINNVRSVKVFVEKLDDNFVERAIKYNMEKSAQYNGTKMTGINQEKFGKSIAEKSVKIAVEKLDINSLKGNGMENIGVPSTRNNMLRKNDSLKVRLEKLDVDRLKKSNKIYFRTRKTRAKRSNKSEVVKIDKNNTGGREPVKRRRRRNVRTAVNSDKCFTKTNDSTPERDVTDYSKSVLSEDISRCLLERGGRAPGEPQNRLEGLFIDNYMEKSDDKSQECEISEYSRGVVLEDVSRSIARRDRRAAGDAEAEIDRIFIDFLMEKPDKPSVELVTNNVDSTQTDRYENKSQDKMVHQIRGEKKAAILEQVRQKYNDRIAELATKAIKREHMNIKYYHNESARNDNSVMFDIGDGYEEIPMYCDENEMNLNSHQCYICLQLFKTKLDLTHHCKEHFQLCNYKMLKKCPFCGDATSLQLKRHLLLKHNVTIDMINVKTTEIDNECGPNHILETEQGNSDVIPSISNFNSLKNDEETRLNRRNRIFTKDLVKKDKKCVVNKDTLMTMNDYQLPEFTIDEYASLNINGVTYEDLLKKLSHLAKGRGIQMLFPCNECSKVCKKMSALVLHYKIHEAKSPKRRNWRNGKITKKINQNPSNNEVKVVRKSDIYKEFADNCIRRRSAKMIVANIGNGSKERAIVRGSTTSVAIGNNVSVIGRKVPANRYADPKPVENEQRSEKEFYKNDTNGGNSKFGQFLKIFNGIENVNHFDELSSRCDFGAHNNDSNTTGSTESLVDRPTNDSNATDHPRSLIDVNTNASNATDHPRSLTDGNTKESNATDHPRSLTDGNTKESNATDHPRSLTDGNTKESNATDHPRSLTDGNTKESNATDHPTSLTDGNTKESNATDHPRSLTDGNTKESNANDHPRSLIDVNTNASNATDHPRSLTDGNTKESNATDHPRSLTDGNTKESNATDHPRSLTDGNTKESNATDHPRNLIDVNTNASNATDHPRSLTDGNTKESNATDHPRSLIDVNTNASNATDHPRSLTDGNTKESNATESK